MNAVDPPEGEDLQVVRGDPKGEVVHTNPHYCGKRVIVNIPFPGEMKRIWDTLGIVLLIVLAKGDTV